MARNTLGLDLGYNYPKGLDLRPSSELHTRIIKNVMDRAKESYGEISKKHTNWNIIENSLNVFIRPEEDKKWKDLNKTAPIVIPISYATLETLLTHFVATFLNGTVFKYEGRSPEDSIKAGLLEHVVQAQVMKSKMGLNLHTQWRDAFSKGFGILFPRWTVERGLRHVARERNIFSRIGRKILGTTTTLDTEEVVLFEGNELVNIDPYYYLPDTNYPIHEPNRGEYQGWIETASYQSLLNDEEFDENLFNMEYLKEAGKGYSDIIGKIATAKGSKKTDTVRKNWDVTCPVDLIHMFIDLVPASDDWQLGKSEKLEKWKFTIGADSIVLEARPAELNHNMFPGVVCAPEYDGYSFDPISKLELIQGMQESVDWLFSSHIANVRKAINDMLIVDPSLVNMNDLLSPRAGKIIRTRRSYWGRGVENIIKQLQVLDVTQGHMKDAGALMDIVHKVAATSDMAEGTPMRAGERVSATEVSGISRGVLNRLGKAAKIVGMQSMQDLAYMLAFQTQQFMEEETWVKLTGTLQETLENQYGWKEKSINVSPEDVLINFDIVPYDGSTPGTEDVKAWTQLWQVFGTSPELAAEFDIVRIFKHIAFQMGAKNVDDFVRSNNRVKPQVMADEDVEKEVGKGNLKKLPK